MTYTDPDPTPPHGMARPTRRTAIDGNGRTVAWHEPPLPLGLTDLLADSVAAIHAQNTRRPIRCMCGCELTFIAAADYLGHRHPSGGRR